MPHLPSLAHLTARRLEPHIENLARSLLGEPTWKSPRVWRFGRKGSLSVHVAGPRRGRWYSFEHNQGGDALDLIAFTRKQSLATALANARAWLGDENV
jgi:putative DNA primase/helicase